MRLYRFAGLKQNFSLTLLHEEILEIFPNTELQVTYWTDATEPNEFGIRYPKEPIYKDIEIRFNEEVITAVQIDEIVRRHNPSLNSKNQSIILNDLLIEQSVINRLNTLGFTLSEIDWIHRKWGRNN